MSDLADAVAENTAFDLLEIRQANRDKNKQVTFAGGHTYEVPVKEQADEK